ncbi:hypothetical protein KIPB_007665 [Kipferlia bialata]|uniref:Uncharacterized protein n=1 Tax=Kipferlia bialata TaxID=797122 RepID=A0A391NV50_9EUKA|nr:hypothetical protein KIPB_007665 [Kipferlia bialata]|eukprot:g7665.t1
MKHSTSCALSIARAQRLSVQAASADTDTEGEREAEAERERERQALATSVSVYSEGVQSVQDTMPILQALAVPEGGRAHVSSVKGEQAELKRMGQTYYEASALVEKPSAAPTPSQTPHQYPQPIRQGPPMGNRARPQVPGRGRGPPRGRRFN